jgi:hypothetical protein
VSQCPCAAHYAAYEHVTGRVLNEQGPKEGRGVKCPEVCPAGTAIDGHTPLCSKAQFHMTILLSESK